MQQLIKGASVMADEKQTSLDYKSISSWSLDFSAP